MSTNDVLGRFYVSFIIRDEYFYGYSYIFLLFHNDAMMDREILLNKPIKVTPFILSLAKLNAIEGMAEFPYIPGLPLFPLIFTDIPIGSWYIGDSKQDKITFTRESEGSSLSAPITSKNYNINDRSSGNHLSITYQYGIPRALLHYNKQSDVDDFGYIRNWRFNDLLVPAFIQFNDNVPLKVLRSLNDEKQSIENGRNVVLVKRSYRPPQYNYLYRRNNTQILGNITLDDSNINDISDGNPKFIGEYINEHIQSDRITTIYKYYSVDHVPEGPQINETKLSNINYEYYNSDIFFFKDYESLQLEGYLNRMIEEVNIILHFILLKGIVKIILDYSRYGIGYTYYLNDIKEKFPQYKNDMDSILKAYSMK
ncbi:MAG: hypothetical protein Solumvirus1_18 [Solumvirus sp.]|uniref:Uncharacterized protein n=1 Tax=Solumvirus sp. TaxID=2487773 RepID=A0A3G5AJL6_9VIRU|nr:MAG: hypothetical protein Solumvirus1_18 [Solumvirus sp.]